MVETSSLQWKGTAQLLKFSTSIYERVIEIEEGIGHAGVEFRGAVGSLAFLRLDISLFWIESEQRYRFCLHVIQPGMAGMFKFGEDSCAIATQFVEGIKRGSMDM